MLNPIKVQRFCSLQMVCITEWGMALYTSADVCQSQHSNNSTTFSGIIQCNPNVENTKDHKSWENGPCSNRWPATLTETILINNDNILVNKIIHWQTQASVNTRKLHSYNKYSSMENGGKLTTQAFVIRTNTELLIQFNTHFIWSSLLSTGILKYNKSIRDPTSSNSLHEKLKHIRDSNNTVPPLLNSKETDASLPLHSKI